MDLLSLATLYLMQGKKIQLGTIMVDPQAFQVHLTIVHLPERLRMRQMRLVKILVIVIIIGFHIIPMIITVIHIIHQQVLDQDFTFVIHFIARRPTMKKGPIPKKKGDTITILLHILQTLIDRGTPMNERIFLHHQATLLDLQDTMECRPNHMLTDEAVWSDRHGLTKTIPLLATECHLLITEAIHFIILVVKHSLPSRVVKLFSDENARGRTTLNSNTS